ncbi:hypothetical protein OIV83_003632 [Microbotryomycetes sp. JL201]|nr:hypothetical protein OIV83_003632 [Microbotryomycetes sp. JL201]
MSLFCAISGQPPLKPVVSTKSGSVYEHSLITKYLQDNSGKDPITGDQLTEDDLIELQTAPSTPAAAPRPPTFTSIPSLLHTLQSEWDATMLECLELRRQNDELRQELSHALYKEDAAMRVLARLTRERNDARDALASVRSSIGAGAAPQEATNGADVEMDAAPEAEAGLPEDARKRVVETNQSLSAVRKKRKPADGYSTPADLQTFTQTHAIPSLHGTKPPGIAALDVADGGQLFVTGGLDKNVVLYNRSTDKIVATLKGHKDKVTAVIASPTIEDGIPSFLVSSSVDKTVRLWTPSGSKTVYGTSSVSLSGEVTSIALHPSHSLLAAASSDGTWSIIDLASGKPVVALTGSLPSDVVEGTSNTAIAFHPDGAIFGVGSSDSRIRIFDTMSGKCIASFDGHSQVGGSDVTSLSFSENGYTLASSAKDSNQVKLWHLSKLTNSANIDLPSGQVVNVVKFDESAQFLCVAGTDVRVYQNKTWAELCKNEENGAEVTGVGFGNLGKEILVAGIDRTVRVLSAPSA